MKDSVDNVKLPIGVNSENETETFDLPNYLLITGYGGGNRSGLLQRMVFSGITQYSSDELNIWLYSDDVLYTFHNFKQYQIAHIKKVFSEVSIEETKRFIVDLNEEIQRRFHIILQTNKHSFREYFEETGEKLAPKILVVIDFAEDFYRHLYECKENIQNMMGEILLLAQALDVSIVLCFGDYRRINWSPYYFRHRIAMKQETRSAELTLEYRFQTKDPWREFDQFYINWPHPHLVKPSYIGGDLEEELRKRFVRKRNDQ